MKIFGKCAKFKQFFFVPKKKSTIKIISIEFNLNFVKKQKTEQERIIKLNEALSFKSYMFKEMLL